MGPGPGPRTGEAERGQHGGRRGAGRAAASTPPPPGQGGGRPRRVPVAGARRRAGGGGGLERPRSRRRGAVLRRSGAVSAGGRPAGARVALSSGGGRALLPSRKGCSGRRAGGFPRCPARSRPNPGGENNPCGPGESGAGGWVAVGPRRFEGGAAGAG